MPTRLTPHFERVDIRGRQAARALIDRLARSTSNLTLIRDLPWELQLLNRAEREQVVRLRARVHRARIGPCEQVLRRIGRWMDAVWGKIK
jgi:hypothetical protein